MADKVRIRHPQASNVGVDSVPLRFIAAGTAKGDEIKRVRGEITLLDENKQPTGEPIRGRQLFFVTRPRSASEKYRWMILFSLRRDQAGSYRLDVVGLDQHNLDIADSEDDVDSFDVGGNFGVSFDYPPPGHTITGQEKDYFCAYGSTDRSVVFADLGAQLAEMIYDDLTINFWSAQFPPLTSSGQQTLEVTDADDQGGETPVYVV